MSEQAVEHEGARHRFVLRQAGEEAELTYRQHAQTLVFDHTWVPPTLRHQGLAEQLAEAALHFARQGGFTVEPECRFMAVYLRRHREWADLLPA